MPVVAKMPVDDDATDDPHDPEEVTPTSGVCDAVRDFVCCCCRKNYKTVKTGAR
jgi:hypothetical protein